MRKRSKQALSGNFHIYGTDKFARYILDVLMRHEINTVGFLDHSPRQPVAQQLSVTSPDLYDEFAVDLGIRFRLTQRNFYAPADIPSREEKAAATG